jgi:TonB family protein
MKSAVNKSEHRARKSERRVRSVCLAALFVSLLSGASFVWAQEAPRPEGSSPIKPPMIKPSMNRSQNPNGGSVNASPRRRRKTTRRKRRAKGQVTTARQMVDVPVPTETMAGSSKSRTITGGVLNGRAKTLPQPEYPNFAKSARASGTVVVEVTIDELGDVISARAVSGHPLLQQASVEAARQAKFTPTILEGRPVKVTGTISYNFVP